MVEWYKSLKQIPRENYTRGPFQPFAISLAQCGHEKCPLPHPALEFQGLLPEIAFLAIDNMGLYFKIISIVDRRQIQIGNKFSSLLVEHRKRLLKQWAEEDQTK